MRQLLIIIVAVFFTGSVFSQDLDQQQKLQQLLRQINHFKSSLNKYETKYQKEYKVLQEKELEIARLSKEIVVKQAEVRKSLKELNKLYAKLEQLSDSINNLEKMIKQDVIAAYKVGKQGRIKMLLSQEDSSGIARILEYYKYVLTARQKSISKYVISMRQIEDVRYKIETKQADREKLLAVLQKKQGNSRKAHSQRMRHVNNLRGRITSTQEQIKEFKQISNQLEKLIVDINSVDSNIDTNRFINISTQKGLLHRPVKKGTLVNVFGSTKIGNLRWHGVQFKAPRLSTVYPVAPGRVLVSSYMRGYGLLILIDHGFDYLSLYAQNHTIYVKEGDWVTPNKRIGAVGNSGGQRDSSLYFELRHKGKELNPKNWF